MSGARAGALVHKPGVKGDGTDHRVHGRQRIPSTHDPSGPGLAIASSLFITWG
jgi:hypothetical protein